MLRRRQRHCGRDVGFYAGFAVISASAARACANSSRFAPGRLRRRQSCRRGRGIVEPCSRYACVVRRGFRCRTNSAARQWPCVPCRRRAWPRPGLRNGVACRRPQRASRPASLAMPGSPGIRAAVRSSVSLGSDTCAIFDRSGHGCDRLCRYALRSCSGVRAISGNGIE